MIVADETIPRPLISKKNVAIKLDVKVDAIDKLPNFPQKIKLSDSKQARVRYYLDEVEQWIESRKQ